MGEAGSKRPYQEGTPSRPLTSAGSQENLRKRQDSKRGPANQERGIHAPMARVPLAPRLLLTAATLHGKGREPRALWDLSARVCAPLKLISEIGNHVQTWCYRVRVSYVDVRNVERMRVCPECSHTGPGLPRTPRDKSHSLKTGSISMVTRAMTSP